jgi:hypothetical protein
MKIVPLLAVLLMAVPGYGAATKSEVQVYPVNPEIRYERGNSQTLVDRQPLNIAVAYQHKKISLLMEYSRFEENTGNATSSIERTHQDLSLWFRHHFLETQSQSMTFSLFGGAGAGTFDEEVKTTLMGASRLDKSPARFVAGLGVGGDLEVAVAKSVDFVVAVEGRTLLASEYDPNPVWSAVLRLGIAISL